MLELTALAAALPSAVPLHALGPAWIQPDHLIETFGAYALIGVCIIVFIETGLLFPLLPGDSLLFTAGALVAQEQLHFPLWLLCGLLFASAFLGDQTAYLIGVPYRVVGAPGSGGSGNDDAESGEEGEPRR